MATPRQVIELLKRKIEANPKSAEGIGASYRFELEGQDGGIFLLNLRPPASIVELPQANPLAAEPGAGEASATGDASASSGGSEVDCVIAVPADDFVALFEGRTDAQQLFFSGKLRISGDIQQAYKLRDLTDLLS
jgi:hypothetical protein